MAKDSEGAGGKEKVQLVLTVPQRTDDLVCIAGDPKDQSLFDEKIIKPGGETVPLAVQCVSFLGRRGKRGAKPWRGRSRFRSSSCQRYDTVGCGPSVFSILTLHDKQCYSCQNGSRDESLKNVAWVDLDGRLVNADAATSMKKIGGQLGRPEAFVWEGLCPLQRVLIVAVATAAANAAKERNSDEVVRLRRVIKKQESALVLMREELSNLLTQVDLERSQFNIGAEKPSPSDSLDELVHLLSQVDIEARRSNSMEPDSSFSTRVNEVIDSEMEKCHSISDISLSPCVNRQLNFSLLTNKISPIKEESPIRETPGLGLVEKMVMSNNWIEALDIDLLLDEEAEKQEYQRAVELVNKDLVLEQIASELDVNENTVELNKGTWERRDTGILNRIQETGNLTEWMSETSSVIMDPFSPLPSEKYFGTCPEETEEFSKDWCRNSVVQAKSFASRARCASIILDIKKQMMSLLDESAAYVLQALAVIGDEIRELEHPERSGLAPPRLGEGSRGNYNYSALKENVNRASMRIGTLQTALVHLWDSFGPQAMSALDICPADFDDYLTNLQIAKILNDDACELATGTVGIPCWEEWFRRGFDNPESSFLRNIQVKELATETEPKTVSNVQLSEWPSSGPTNAGREPRFGKASSPTSIDVRLKVEKLLRPIFESDQEAGTAHKHTNMEAVAEEIITECEKSAAKVSSLKKYVKACDLKRKQVERKLLEAWEQDSKNQVKATQEIVELKRQVRLKETAYQQLISSRKALVSSKTKEISELREDCRRHNMALQDMAAAAKATQEGSEKRLAMLEEICRKKDNSIISLKQEIFELEGKVQELQACQTPAQLRPMNLPPAERDTDTESADDLFGNENNYRTFGDDCQLRSSYQSMCGSENRRTSWGSDLSAQEFHIIDTPWSSELSAGQDFNVIEEAAFQGRSLSIFQNVTSSQEFLRGSLRKLGITPGGGLDIGTSNSGDPDSRQAVNLHRESRLTNENAPKYRKELSKSVSSFNATRSKREDKLRASTGVLSAVGPNTPFKPRRSTSVSKERSALESSLNGTKPKENSSRTRQQKWV